MRTINLADIEGLEEGESIPAIRGRVKSVYEYKEGNNDKGPWSVQNLVLTDGKTDVRVVAWNLHDLEEIKGKEVLIESNKGQRGLNGVQKSIEDYQGKTYHKVKLSNACKIRDANENSEDQEIPMNPVANGKPVTQDGVKQTRQHLMKSANLYNLCADCVDAVVKPNIENMSADLYQAAIGTLFIEASRWGGVEKMPAVPIKDPAANKLTALRKGREEEDDTGNPAEYGDGSPPF